MFDSVSGSRFGGPSRGVNFQRENVLELRRLQSRIRQQYQRKQVEEDEKKRNRPFKAFSKYCHVQPKVTKIEIDPTKTTRKSFLQAHQKTGPFLSHPLPQTFRDEDDDVPLASFDNSDDRISSIAISRFSKVSISERKDRIGSLLSEICSAVPLGKNERPRLRRTQSLKAGRTQEEGKRSVKPPSPPLVKREQSRKPRMKKGPTKIDLNFDSNKKDDGNELKLGLSSVNDPSSCNSDVDYVSANVESASVIGTQWRQISSSTKAMGKTQSNPIKIGVIPKYLRDRQEAWREEAEMIEREKPDPDCPPNHRKLSEEERMSALEDFSSRFQNLVNELSRFPVQNDTLRIRQRKREIELELTKTEEAIRTYSRLKVFVKISPQS